MNSESKYRWFFWIIALGMAALKVAFTLRPEINLFTEEAQYWLWSQNLAWHYYSKPPLIALINFFSTSLLGINELGVRINAIVFGIGTAWVVFLFTKYLYNSEKIAFWASLMVMSTPFWIIFSTVHMTDSELVFFWILSTYWVFRGIRENSAKWWALGGLASALGLMAKGTMILIGPFVLIYLLLTKEWRLHRLHFLAFLGAGAFGFFPGFIWNLQNNFTNYKHLAFLSGVAGEGHTFDFMAWMGRFGEFGLGQIAIFSIFLFPFLVIASISFFRNPTKTDLYLLLFPVLSWIGFGLVTFLNDVEANWPVFAYPVLPIFMSKWFFQQSETWLKFRNWGVTFSLGIPLLLLSPDLYSFKDFQVFKKVEKASFRRMVGYEPLAKRIEFLRDSLHLGEDFLFSESYHMASEMAFYLPDHPQTYTVNLGTRKNQFDLWEGLENQVGKDRVGIFVSWNKNSPEGATVFEELVYEEKFPVWFKGDSLRQATIQIWKNLQEYTPLISDTY
ncbi:glycosyltransferase family 39 protein [Algoriphagus sp. CAU 1675]|uniref:ArnT family glycosyltransferase n=1 Tax=Algoriphagus sp. CAU 1675 TaxID=3032597 RepID=UPI0023DAC448|nr:glycosyltransferase family 39 protein [Algoriphagus sp. CAU 1675]MDF2158779.1 glycosyltransferase family 39 protein [Algoriphagus sp. CAU 1675]